MSTPVPDPRDRGPRLALDVALIVVIGVALGLAYNHSMLLANDDRALSWTVKPRSTGVLDLATPAPTGTTTAPAGDAASAPAPTSAPSSGATTGTTPESPPSATTAPHDSAAHAAPAKTTSKPSGTAKKSASKSGATAKSASAGSSPAHGPIPTDESAAKPATPAPAAGTAAASVPVIPDTREPLEANYAVIKALHDANAALFVDARTAEEYAAGHIPGAVSLPFDDVFKKPDLAKQLDSQGRPIVTYCDGGDCELSKDLAFSLIDNGHKKVVFFKDGLPGWKSAGNEVHTGAQP
ncbi:MAG: rhodanese-like domain-containing protein [Candidatus Eisenbacteria bacterium]